MSCATMAGNGCSTAVSRFVSGAGITQRQRAKDKYVRRRQWQPLDDEAKEKVLTDVP